LGGSGAFGVWFREIFEFLSLLGFGTFSVVVEDGLLFGVKNERHRILLNIISFYSICNTINKDEIRQIGF
jgi:hypothetical protein